MSTICKLRQLENQQMLTLCKEKMIPSSIGALRRCTCFKLAVLVGLGILIYRTTFHSSDSSTLPEKKTKSLEVEECDQADPFLLRWVRQHHILEPSAGGSEVDANPNGIILSIWPVLREIVGKNTKGFFVEAGAYDGVAASNTFWLEKERAWSGLLVECHPDVVPLLKNKNRKAYISDACLSQFPHAAEAELTSVDGWHPSSSLGTEKNLFPDFAETFTKYKVQTVPLYSLLAAINVATVDFFSLDIQGLEYSVLRHFPFDSVFVKVWLIEVDLLTAEDQDSLGKLMKANGYMGPKSIGDSDRLYVHRSVVPPKRE